MSKVEEIFEKQLEKTGIFKYLVEQKRNGRIKHLGFSAHGCYDVIKRFLEAYSSELEFCQLQISMFGL